MEGMVKELDFLRAKDAAFADADKQADLYKEKISELEKDLERVTTEAENMDFQNRVLKKENE